VIDPQRAEDMEQLVQKLPGGDGPPLRGVIHMWSLDARAPEEAGPAALDEAARLGCGSVLHLVQQLARRAAPEPPSLWLLTRGAQYVGEGQTGCAVAQAPLWGLGKVIALEQPGLRCARLDLDPAGDADEAARILRELAAPDGEDQIAFRGGVRHVQRLKGARLS
jgi:hypothetical protein